MTCDLSKYPRPKRSDFWLGVRSVSVHAAIMLIWVAFIYSVAGQPIVTSAPVTKWLCEEAPTGMTCSPYVEPVSTD